MIPKSLDRRTVSLFLGVFALSSSALLQAAPPKMRDAPTNEDLLQRTQQAANNRPLSNLNPRKVEEGQKLEDPTKSNQPKDLIATSDFLSFGGMSTLIPKRALLHVPKNYQGRIQFERGSNLVIWPTFYNANRGWIKTMEVTRGQAQGVEPFDEKVAENLAKSSIVVVATYKGGPISVLPYKDPEAVEVPAEGEGAAVKEEGAKK